VIFLVKLRRSASILLMMVAVKGDQTEEQYSSNGPTYITKVVIKILQLHQLKKRASSHV
jgi:hypothetical protein